MARYVIFPGTAGSYADTPSVNELDSDTAHMQQSKGGWDNIFQAKVPALSSDVTPVFGDSTLKGIANTGAGAAGAVFAAQPTGTGALPVSAATEYSAGVSLQAIDDLLQGAIYFRWFDAGGSSLGDTARVETDLSDGVWTEITATATSHASAAFGQVRVAFSRRDASGVVDGDTCYLDAALMAAGSDGTFLPSLRIVGDLDLRAKVALVDWTPATNQRLIDNLDGANGYAMYIHTGGRIYGLNGDGATDRTDWSDQLTLTAGASYEVRYTMDVSTGATAFYVDGGAEGTGSETVAASSPSGAVLIAGGPPSVPFEGDMYWAEVRDGIDGPIVAIFDAEDIGL